VLYLACISYSNFFQVSIDRVGIGCLKKILREALSCSWMVGEAQEILQEKERATKSE